MIRAASRRPSARTSSLSCRTSCALLISPGRSSRSSPINPSSSPRLTTQDADIGIARADSSVVVISASLDWTLSTRLRYFLGLLLGLELREQPATGGLRHEPGHVAAVRRDLFDQTR